MIDNYITGASGFIGRNLASQLHGCIRIPHEEIRLFKGEECRRFFFLSAYGNLASHTNVDIMIHANVLDLVHVLGRIKPAKDFLFIYVSSSSVHLPVQTPYSLMKRAGESIVAASGLPYLIIRPYSVTGVGEQSEHLIPTLIRSCMTQCKVNVVMGAVHDFVDVQDVVSGIVMFSDARITGVIELGLGIGISNREVLDIVEVCSGRRANVAPIESLRSYDTMDWRCKDERAMELGWAPKKTLKDSVVEMCYAAERS